MTAGPPMPGPPPLENGERLSSDEFMRRYEAMPDARAELIEGVVYMSSPVRVRKHAHPHAILTIVLGYYVSKTPGVIVCGDVTLRLDGGNNVQPDVTLCLPPHAGGQAAVTDDDYLTASPELVVEVACSTSHIDLHDKLDAYRRNRIS